MAAQNLTDRFLDVRRGLSLCNDDGLLLLHPFLDSPFWKFGLNAGGGNDGGGKKASTKFEMNVEMEMEMEMVS
jgi:hypothetical protein